jgi:hypothetical protein
LNPRRQGLMVDVMLLRTVPFKLIEVKASRRSSVVGANKTQ